MKSHQSVRSLMACAVLLGALFVVPVAHAVSASGSSAADVVIGTVVATDVRVEADSGRVVTDVTLASGAGLSAVAMEGGETGEVGMWTELFVPVSVGQSVAMAVVQQEDGPAVSAPPVTLGISDSESGKAISATLAGYVRDPGGIHWAADDLPVGFRINTANSPSGSIGAISDAAQTWEDDAGSDMDFSYLGTTSAAAGDYGGGNAVDWGLNTASGTLALCTFWYNPTTYEIQEFGIQYNRAYAWTTTGASGSFDVQAVGTHELGHTLHLGDLYDASDSIQTMYGYVAAGSIGPRTLEWGDRAGIAAIYPTAAPPDTTPPITSIIAGVTGQWEKNDQTVILSAVDAESGVKQTWYQHNGGNSSPYVSGILVGTEGVSTISYWSVDNADNAESPSSVTVRVDKTRPATGCDAVTAYSGTARVTLTPSDMHSGVAHTYYRVDGASWAEGTSVVVGTGGNHVLEFYSADEAGNAEVVQSRSFSVVPDDFDPPVTQISVPTDGWSASPQTVILSATDSGSGVKATSYSLDGGPATAYPAAGVTISKQGTSTIACWSEDYAGNTEDPRSKTVRVDSGPPSVSIAPASGNDRVLTVTAADGLSGLERVWYAIDGSAAVATNTAQFSVELGQGRHTLVAWATDAVGNRSVNVTGGTKGKATTLALTSGSATLGSYGASFKVRGSLKHAGAAVPGATVILQSGSSSTSFADTSTRATTDGNGGFTLVVVPRSRTYYRVRFAGTQLLEPSGPTSVVWAKPRAYVGNPKAPTTMRKSKAATVYGYLKPHHAKGSYPVRIYKWRRVGGKWRSNGYVKAKASDYSKSTYTKYSKSLSLSSRGKWRLRAYHPADAGHAGSWSGGYDYVTVK